MKVRGGPLPSSSPDSLIFWSLVSTTDLGVAVCLSTSVTSPWSLSTSGQSLLGFIRTRPSFSSLSFVLISRSVGAAYSSPSCQRCSPSSSETRVLP